MSRFVIDENEEKERTFKRVVKFKQPNEGGGSQQMSFKVEFLEIGSKAIRETLDEGEDEESATRDLLERVIVNFENVYNEENKPVEYSERLRDMLIDRPYIRAAITQEFFDALSGGKTKERKTKN